MEMKRLGCIFGLSIALCYGGFSSGSSLSKDTTLNHTHQLIGFQSRGDALGWLEIKQSTQAPITLKVSPIHLQVIQPIWSVDKDDTTLLSAFGIANLSPFEVSFDSSRHRILFPSIATMTSNSLITGVYQNPQSTFVLKGELKFDSISHQGLKGSSFGILGGALKITQGKMIFDLINAEYRDSYGLSADVVVDKDSSLLFDTIKAGGNAYGISGRIQNQGKITFEKIVGGDQGFGYSGDAVGIEGEVSNSSILSFGLIRAKNGGSAYGVSANTTNEGTITLGQIISNEGNAYGISGGLKGEGGVEIGEVRAGSSVAGGRAYGIYNLSSSSIQGNLRLSSLSSIKDYRNQGGESYGIYNLGVLEIDDSNLVFSSIQGDEVFPIYSQGVLNIKDSTLAFGTEAQGAVISVRGGEIVLQEANLIASQGGGIAGEARLRILEGGNVLIDTPQQALLGEIEVFLEPRASLRFGSDAKMKTLSANGGATLEIRSKSATLDVYDFLANDSNFILTSSLQSSDKIIIHHSSTKTPLKNNLYVKLYEISTTPNYVLLVSMPKELGDRIVFNELIESSTQSRSVAYVGFDEVSVDIKRHDTQERVYYYSDLVAKDYKINTNFLLPTQVALNANHSLFLLNTDSLDVRMGELRGGVEGSGIWGRLNFGKGRERMQKDSEINFFSFQSGYDYDFLLLNAYNYVGFFANYLRSVTTQEGGEYQNISLPSSSYDVITQGFEVGVYNSYVRDEGIFSDSLAKFVGLFSKAQMPYQTNPYNLTTYAFSLSQEVGYRFLLPKGVYFDLQTDLLASYLSSQDLLQELEIDNMLYTLSSKQNPLYVLKSKSGLSLGYEWRGENFSLGVSVGGFYVFHSFYGGEIEYLSSSSATLQNDPYSNNHQGILNIGINLALKEKTRLFFDFEKSFGGRLIKDFSINFGARFALGKSPQRGKPQEEQESLEVSN